MSEPPAPGPRAARRQRLIAAIVYSGTALSCLALFVGFFALRAWRKPFPRAPMRLTGDWMMQRDPEIGYVSTPSARTVWVHLRPPATIHVYTDRRGARINAPGEETPAQIDFLTVGCSFSWGHLMENEETYTEQLSRLLGRRGANLAKGGYSGLNSIQILKRNLDLEPRVVIYGVINAQLVRNLSPCAPSFAPFCVPVSYVEFDEQVRPIVHPPNFEYFDPDLNRRFFREVFMREPGFSWNEVFWRMRVDLLGYRDRRAFARDATPLGERKAQNLVFREMIAATESIGAKLVVLFIPAPSRDAVEGPRRALRESLVGRPFAYLSMERAFREHYADPSAPALDFPGDGHPNALAHLLIARELAPVVERLLAEEGTRPARP
jgi:hypothetical protein